MPSSTPREMIRITVRLFSVLRHRSGQIVDRLDLELPRGSRAADVLALLNVNEALEPSLALNSLLVDADALLSDGDTLAIIPAVAGG